MPLPATLRNAPHVDVEAFSVFVESEKLADATMRRVIYGWRGRTRQLPHCGAVRLAGRRIYWCLRCLVNDPSIYREN